MRTEILPILMCPVCLNNLYISEIQARNDNEIIEGIISCSSGHFWKIKDGILDFEVVEGPSDHWSKLYGTYDQYVADLKLKEKILTIDRIINIIKEDKPQVLVDIASGMGTLVNHILMNVDHDMHIIITDLSLSILRYDRQYMTQNYPNKKISFIACDAANLPFKNSEVNLFTSFGLENLLDKLVQGIAEAGRVLKPQGQLIYQAIIINENSEGFRVIDSLRKEGLNIVDKAGTEEGIYNAICNKDFSQIVIDKLYDGIGDSTRSIEEGILPYPGEWYQDVVVRCIK